jgi:hypothetical protein
MRWTSRRDERESLDPRPRHFKGYNVRYPEENPMADKREMSVKMPDNVLPGVYSNQMMVSHTREEFVMDFLNLFPPQGVVNARVIVSPGHLKRMIRALRENLSRYETRFGPIIEAAPPETNRVQN